MDHIKHMHFEADVRSMSLRDCVVTSMKALQCDLIPYKSI